MNTAELTAYFEHVKTDAAMRDAAASERAARERRMRGLSEQALEQQARSIYERGARLGAALFSANDIPNGEIEIVSPEARALKLSVGDYSMRGVHLGEKLAYYRVSLDLESTVHDERLTLVQVFMAREVAANEVALREHQLENFQTLYDATGLPPV